MEGRDPISQQAMVAVGLSGGRDQQMGGEDKKLWYVGHRPLIAWVLTALYPQVSRILIGINRNRGRHAVFGLPAVPDR